MRALLGNGFGDRPGRAVAFGYLSSSPFTRRPIERRSAHLQADRHRHLAKTEIRGVATCSPGRPRSTRLGIVQSKALEALVNLVAWTGLRLGEATHCHVDDLDLDGGIVWVVSRATYRLKTAGSEKFVISRSEP